MKLVELLARELDVWPGCAEVATQDGGGMVCFSRGPLPVFGAKYDDEWSFDQSGAIDCDGRLSLLLATDHATAIITRADWQAERERIAGGWISWGGGECPVDNGVRVDVRYRCGDESMNQPALEAGNLAELWATDWAHTGHTHDIIAYRLHKPEQASAEAIDVGIAAADAGKVKPIEEVKAMHEYNPIHTRNRIREIDRTTEALEEERVSLVQRLADEGFVLARVDGKVVHGEPEEWLVGDLLEITGEEEGHEFEIGQIVVITRIDKDDEVMPYYCKPAVGDGEPWFVNSNEAKFHSRPAA